MVLNEIRTLLDLENTQFETFLLCVQFLEKYFIYLDIFHKDCIAFNANIDDLRDTLEALVEIDFVENNEYDLMND